MTLMPSKTSVDPHLFLNTTIDRGTIRLVSVLGVGAYGIVYLGQNTFQTQKLCAVKLLTIPFTNEATLHAHVSGHEHILQLEKVVHEQGRVFLVLEYAREGDLFTAITQSGRGIVGNNSAIRHIFLQIIDAVQHCHRRGVAHRDLKPENILMFPHHHIKLADFGLATTDTISTDLGCGSTFYFSPECYRGLVRHGRRIRGYCTQPNDVWSLGVILINLTVGRNPWKQASASDPTFSTYLRQPHRFFQRILPGISNELDGILSTIFCIDPSRRISLPELRIRIACCRSFTRPHTIPCSTVNRQQVPSSCGQSGVLQTAQLLKCTTSQAMSMLMYVRGYTDGQTPKPPTASTVARSFPWQQMSGIDDGDITKDKHRRCTATPHSSQAIDTKTTTSLSPTTKLAHRVQVAETNMMDPPTPEGATETTDFTSSLSSYSSSTCSSSMYSPTSPCDIIPISPSDHIKPTSPSPRVANYAVNASVRLLSVG